MEILIEEYPLIGLFFVLYMFVIWLWEQRLHSR